MGYTTKFSGKFKIEPALSFAHRAELKARIDDETWPDEFMDQIPPRSYCQWIPTKDGAGLEWDGGEKFYEYDSWIEFLAAFLAPLGYAVTGSVVFRGESRDDVGTLSICDGKATKEPLRPLPWAEVRSPTRKTIRAKLAECLSDADSDEEADAWRAVLSSLGEPAA